MSKAVRSVGRGVVRFGLPALVVAAVAAMPGSVLIELAGHTRSDAEPSDTRASAREPDHTQSPRVRPEPKPELVVATSSPTTTGSAAPVVSALGASGIPDVALRAYRAAEATMALNDPGCGLRWSLLAAIARVESNHGRFAGVQLREDGTGTGLIRGIPLDGRPGVATIRDTDGGVFDGDTVWDRAVGPFQFIPSSWRFAAADGNGDGVKDPNNIFDGALAAAGYLCAGDRDLRDVAQRARAVFSYNHSDQYVRVVLALADQYEQGPITALPTVPAAPTPPPVLPSPELPPASVTPPPTGPDVGLPPTTTTLPPATTTSSTASTTTSTSTTSSTSTTVPCPTTTSSTSTVPDPSSTTTTSTTTTTTIPDPSSTTTTTTVVDPGCPTTTVAGAADPASTPPATAAIAPELAAMAALSAAGSWWVRRRARRSRPRTWPGSSGA